MRKTIGDIIVELGFIAEDRAKRAVGPGDSNAATDQIGMLLLEKALTRVAGFSRALALARGRSFLKLGRNKIELEFLESVSPELLMRFNYISVEKDGNYILIAVDPADSPEVSEVDNILSCLVSQVIFTPKDISSLFGQGAHLDADGYVQFSTEAQSRQRIGDILVRNAFVTRDTVEDVALSQNEETGKKLGTRLIEEGHLTYTQLAHALAIQSKLPFVRLTRYRISPEFLADISTEMMAHYSFVPLEREGSRLLVAVADPTDQQSLFELEQVLEETLDYVVASPADISKAIFINTVIDNQRHLEDQTKGFDYKQAPTTGEVKPEDTGGLGKKLGDIMVEKGLVERGVVEEAVAVQAAGVEDKLGEILVRWQQVTPGQLEQALAYQADLEAAPIGEVAAEGVVEEVASSQAGMLGEILVQLGFVAPGQVEKAVLAQADGANKKLGELFLDWKQITPGQLKRALSIQAAFGRPTESWEAAVPRKPIGDILVEKGLVERGMVEKAASLQAAGAGKPIGQLLLEWNHVTPAQLERVLAEQAASAEPVEGKVAEAVHKPIGDILVDKGFVAREAVEEAASAQLDGADKKLGVLLVEGNHVTPAQLALALTEQADAERRRLEAKAAECKPIGDILVEMGLAERGMVEKAADIQACGVKKQLGQFLEEWDHVKPEQLKRALTEQAIAAFPADADVAAMPRLIGDILVENGFVDRTVVEAVASAQVDGVEKKLGELLVEDNHVTPAQLERALALQAACKNTAPEETAPEETLTDKPVAVEKLDVIQASLKEKLARDMAAMEEMLQEEKAVLEQSFKAEIAATRQKAEEAAELARRNAEERAALERQLAEATEARISADGTGLEEIAAERAALEAQASARLASAEERILSERKAYEERLTAGQEMLRQMMDANAVLEKRLAQAKTAFTSRLTFEMNDMEEMIETSNNLKRQLTKVLD